MEYALGDSFCKGVRVGMTKIRHDPLGPGIIGRSSAFLQVQNLLIDLHRVIRAKIQDVIFADELPVGHGFRRDIGCGYEDVILCLYFCSRIVGSDCCPARVERLNTSSWTVSALADHAAGQMVAGAPQNPLLQR